jgi:heme oxygenase
MADLRRGTHADHVALEESDWLAEALRDRASYAQHLARVAAFRRASSAALAPYAAQFGAHGFVPEQRDAGPALAAEREALAASGFAAAEPPPPPFPALPTFSAAVGCAYVLAGSTLGGRLIARSVRERLAWESPFYDFYGPETGAMWRAFGDAVRGLGAAFVAAEAIAAADATFAAYGASIADIA